MTVKKQSIADATILCLGAILEALPPKTQVSAARLARESLEAGLASDEQSERIVRGVFLLGVCGKTRKFHCLSRKAR
jgi:hypothetical protein